MRYLIVLCMMASCCPHDGLREHGLENAPDDRFQLYDAARESGCELRGDIYWVKEPIENQRYPYPLAGYCSNDACGFEIHVASLGMPSACRTALAHELGHGCLNTSNEQMAENYGQALLVKAGHCYGLD